MGRTLLLALSAVLTLLAASAFNYAVDPKHMFSGDPAEDVALRMDGYHRNGDELNFQELWSKIEEVEKVRPSAVLMGASPVFFGMDPAYAGWRAPAGARYNMGIRCATAKNLRQILERLVKLGSVRQVLLGLSFFSFNDHQPDKGCPRDRWIGTTTERAWKASKYMISELADLRNLLKGVRDIGFGRDVGYGAPELRRWNFAKLNGLATEYPKWRDSDKRVDVAINFERHQAQFIAKSYYPARYGFVLGDPVTGTSAALEEFRRFLRIAKRNDIDVIVFLPPTHARDLELLRWSHLWQVWERWKRSVVRIVDEVLPGQPVFDFTGYTRLTTQDVRDPLPARDVNFGDPIHFTLHVGDQIFDTLFCDGCNSDIVRRLEPGNVEANLREIRRSRARYASADTAFVADTRRIYFMLGRY